MHTSMLLPVVLIKISLLFFLLQRDKEFATISVAIRKEDVYALAIFSRYIYSRYFN